MKRSQINAAIRFAEDLMGQHRFALPPFAAWTPEDWKAQGAACDPIREAMLGWDVTDLGRGDFEAFGLTLFTVRNGKPNTGRPYCEKIMVVRGGQVCATHFHWKKTEDIINRGGGSLVMEIWRAGEDEALSDHPVPVLQDGVRKTYPAGTKVILQPGESMTLEPYLYHNFYSADPRGAVLVGEVSTVNDDAGDNRFLEPAGRYPPIEEDEAPYRLLCNEYPSA